jgi:hypothetical protein
VVGSCAGSGVVGSRFAAVSATGGAGELGLRAGEARGVGVGDGGAAGVGASRDVVGPLVVVVAVVVTLAAVAVPGGVTASAGERTACDAVVGGATASADACAALVVDPRPSGGGAAG